MKKDRRQLFRAFVAASASAAITGWAGSARGVAPGRAAGTPGEAEPPAWAVQFDDWYALSVGEAPAGWMHIVREDDGQRYRTVTEMVLRLERAGLDASNHVEWIESHDGEPLRFEVSRRADTDLTDPATTSVSGGGSDPLTDTRAWEFDGHGATLIATGQDGPVRVPSFRPEGDWLTPAAEQRLISRRIADHAATIEYGTIDLGDTIRTVEVTSTLVGPDALAVDGRVVPVTVWRTQTSVNPGETLSSFAADGRLVRSLANVGVGVVETRLCTRQQALGAGHEATAAAGPAGPGISPDRAVDATAHRAVYDVRIERGLLPALPSTGAQIVEMSPDRTSARVTVDAAASAAATAPELAEASLRDGAPAMDADAALVANLAAQSLREATGLSRLDLAHASRAVIHRHGSGSPAATPTGHGQSSLLCAVLRAHKIPSRLASGLACEAPDGRFMWRVWTQALIDGRWIDLDPSEEGPWTVGHILTGYGTVGARGGDADPMRFASLMSDLKINVVSQE